MAQNITPAIAQMANAMSRDIFGMTRARAVEKKVCLNCKEDPIPKCHTATGMSKWLQSGLCEECFNEICG